MAKAYIVGVGMIPFAKPGQSESFNVMGEKAARLAMSDAGIDYKDVQRAYAGYIFGNTCGGQEVVYRLGLTGVPVFNVNNACASGSSALFMAREAIEAGAIDVALAVGFEQMVSGPIPNAYADRPQMIRMKELAERLKIEGFNPNVPLAAQIYGTAGNELMERYGYQHETFARISVKSRQHAANNPYAVFRKPTTVEEVLADKPIFGPLTRSMCSPPTCGAAAVILVSETFLKQRGLDNSVMIAGQALTTDAEDSYDKGMTEAVGLSMSTRGAKQAYELAGVGPEDIDVVELHDCFASNELISYEALGFCPAGGAEKMVLDGDNTYGGRLVVNPSGGLISKGHPIGATGLAQITELTWQLRGQAEQRQVGTPRVAMQHNVGMGGACVVTLLKR